MFNQIKDEDLPFQMLPDIARLAEIETLSKSPSFKDLAKEANYDRGRINEPQFLTRLKESNSDKERRELTCMQYAYRAKLLNTALRFYQQAADIASLLDEARTLVQDVMVNLHLVKDPELASRVMAACVSMGNRILDNQGILERLLGLTDGVQELPWYKTYEAMRLIFEDLSLYKPTFGARAYDFYFIDQAEVKGIEAELQAAVQKTIAAFWARREVASQLRGRHTNLNRKQYSSRLEAASLKGDTELFESIVKEQKGKEAEFYCLAIARRHATEELDEAADRLEPVLRKAFRAIKARGEVLAFGLMEQGDATDMADKYAELLRLHIAMNNCAAAHKWLVEAKDRPGKDDKFERLVDEIIAEFDAVAFIKEVLV